MGSKWSDLREYEGADEGRSIYDEDYYSTFVDQEVKQFSVSFELELNDYALDG